MTVREFVRSLGDLDLWFFCILTLLAIAIWSFFAGFFSRLFRFRGRR